MMLNATARGGPARRARRRGRRAFSVAVQPSRYEMAEGQRLHPDEEQVTTHYQRIFKTKRKEMFDPALAPEHEVFQIENFWKELQRLLEEWRAACDVVDKVRAGEAPQGMCSHQVDRTMLTAHLLGDKIFKFFTHMRAHLDRNPRDRIGFYDTRPAGMEDVYGLLMGVLARQIDTDYCPRCHLRNDGSTTVCGDPTVVNEFLYGDNHVMNFEAPEVEHSFWTPSWFIEYEGRAKGLWYQSLQLPFFRTATHTALQCESMMDIYRGTLNRGEANHFMRQCQVHGFPITQRMVDSHTFILENTNPCTVFFHGDPTAVSPRHLRLQMEQEKLDAMEAKDGLIKLPPASYLPHADAKAMYSALPESFQVEEDGWVSNFKEVSQAIQDSADAWSPVSSQRAQSAEFPDSAYSEQDLAEAEFWRGEIAKAAVRTKPDNLKVGRRVFAASRSRVSGITTPQDEADKGTGFVFPTADGYEVFDVSDEAFKPLRECPSQNGDAYSEMLKFAIKSGARLKATALAQSIEPHNPHLTHRFPIREEHDNKTDSHKLPVVSFSALPRAMIEILEYEATAQKGESIERWRQTSRPWCNGKWEELEAKKEYKNIRVGGKLSKLEGGGGTLTLVGAYDGKVWAAKAGERFASVVVGAISSYKPVASGVDVWSVQEQIEVEGTVVGVKAGDDLPQVWVQWGPNSVATPVGVNVEDIGSKFRNLEVLTGTLVPVEPPSWNIPFRNNWREERLQEVLRKPWTDMPFTPTPSRQMPVETRNLHDPKSYGNDDYRTKEYEKRIDTRNMLGGSTRIVGDRRWRDDVVFSVNMEGNGTVHTGYGQPQVDTDELSVPLGVEDGSNDRVEGWEIDEMEQCLRDIGGRAPGAAHPRVDTIAPDATVNDPIEVRRYSRMRMSDRMKTLLDPRNPANTDMVDMDKGLLATRNQLKKQGQHEYGGYRDVGQMEVMPHEKKLLLGDDATLAPHTRLHMNGSEDQYHRVPKDTQQAVAAFRQLNEYYEDICQPFDVGHQDVFSLPTNSSVQTNRPAHTMSVGKKRRMAGLLLRLFMRKLEDIKKASVSAQPTLDWFVREYQINRLALMAWFGGDSPATPSVLAAVKSFLYAELKDLDLLDELKLESVDTYSPVYEPGFYKWLDKSRFEHQYELLLGAKLNRFHGHNIQIVDPLSQKPAREDRVLDVSEQEELQKYHDRLMGGNISHMSKTALDEYDARTGKVLPRVAVSPRTNQAGANLKDVEVNLGMSKDKLGRDVRLTGLLSLNDLRRAIGAALIQNETDHRINPGIEETDRLQGLAAGDPMDAEGSIAFAKQWNEGMSMDILYAIRRNKSNAALRQRFESLLDLTHESQLVQDKLDGLYEHASGAFRVTKQQSRYVVENATLNDAEWVGDLTEVSDNEYTADIATAAGPAGVLRATRVGNDTFEFTLTPEATKDTEAPVMARAKRADLDLQGTMWNLYVQGQWAPGVDEANVFAHGWAKKNSNLIVWDIVTKELKPADISFVKAALVSNIDLEYSEPFVDGNDVIREVTASGALSSVDSWVSSIPSPSSDMLSVLKMDQKNGTFSFTCRQVATDVQPVEAARDLPFVFDSYRTEQVRTQQKWWRLGMQLHTRDVPVLDRKGVPRYGELVELLHWLDELVTKVDQEVEEVLAKKRCTLETANSETREEVKKLKQVQTACVTEVIDYQRNMLNGADPVLLGSSGLNASLGGKKLNETVVLTGFVAKVLDRQLPLLRWWNNVIAAVDAERNQAKDSLHVSLTKTGLLRVTQA